VSIPEPLVRSFTIGRFKAHAIQAGGQKLDGGAMFGVVPKPLWERRIKADDRNRIQLGMRCLLIEHDRGLVLIDNGAGNKENPSSTRSTASRIPAPRAARCSRTDSDHSATRPMTSR
jgi:hypothetical protein